ncbi:MED14-domain-containing protein [Dacryopinax primogenitus]|uniref:Mediator of RNA polymerase II transcription subunit 14 n=1 Tax=Dacryopinax primogenitus (strain DJM 731) TaxID=1858805 RepID=M5G170_DACPD|nr:MED14-domain-containing protein [Dacryopinax primogenitus]EJU03986.1 MED14-domain-containing protein [Dacryopinax primogenitus]
MTEQKQSEPNGIVSPNSNHVNGNQHAMISAKTVAPAAGPPPLPQELSDMVPLREIIARLVQKSYEDLQNLIEVLPSKSDVERKHAIRDYGSHTRKQVVKALVLTRWARDSAVVQRCQDVRFFLQVQNGQFREASQRLYAIKEGFMGARSRQWDLLTAIDVLSTGKYLRLPKAIKEWFLPPTPPSPASALQTLQQMDHVLRLRLRAREIIPIEMSRYSVSSGRVTFTAPNLFRASFVTGGAEPSQIWYLLGLEFLIGAKDKTRVFERFPRKPQGFMRDQIINLVNQQLALGHDPGTRTGDAGVGAQEQEPHARRRRKGKVVTVDAPLVRAYNFLQMFALSYQLEILSYQASQLLSSLGWASHLRLEHSRDRRTLTASYWQRPRPPPPAGNPPWPASQSKIYGGTVTVSLESRAHQGRTALGKVLADLEDRTKSGHTRSDVTVRTRDTVDGLRLRVIWTPSRAWLGVEFAQDELQGEEFDVDPSDLDFERSVMRRVVGQHAGAVVGRWGAAMRRGPAGVVWREEEMKIAEAEGGTTELHLRFRPQELTVISLDGRSGAFVVREQGVLPSVSRSEKIAALVKQINDKPGTFVEAVCMTRFQILLEDLENNATVLRTHVTRTRLVRPQDMPAFGSSARLCLYISLASFPSHYLVLVLADQGLQYAMLKVALVNEDVAPDFRILECAWLDIRRITGQDPARDPGLRWSISQDALCDLYAFCRARVAHAELEQQLRDVKIASWPTFDSPSAGGSRLETLPLAPPLLQKEVPTIRIESSAFLGAMSSDASTMSADAWCAYIALRAINWTRLYGSVGAIVSVALRSEFFVPLADEKSTTGEYAGVRVKLDSKTGVINFHLENVHGAILAFLRAWEGVSKAVSVAREVRTMSQEPRYTGVQLLSFTLSSVSLLYQNSFALTISSHGATSLGFSYHGTPGRRNPHEEGVDHYSRVFEESGPRKLIEILRDTLPLLLEFDQLDVSAQMRWSLREAGWVRAVYGQEPHALDYRLLPNSRILVVDGAVHLFNSAGKVLFTQHPIVDLMRESSEKFSGVYKVIDGLPNLLLDVTRSVAKERVGISESGNRKMPDVIPLDAGLICHQDAVRDVVRLMHEGMLKLLDKEDKGKAKEKS